MMGYPSKDDLRAMRMRANDVYKRNLLSCVGMTLLYSLVSVGLSFLMVYIQNAWLAAFTLLVQAFIAASLLLGLRDYFICLSRGEKASAKLLMRYFDQESLPMVALLAGINWLAGMIGTLLGGLALALQLFVSALVFLVPYLYIVRGGSLRPFTCLQEAVTRMQGRWNLYIRILMRQYLYTIAASLALSVLLVLLTSVLSSVGLAALAQSDLFILIFTLICSVIISAFVMAYFQIYQAEFALSTICQPKPEEKDHIV